MDCNTLEERIIQKKKQANSRIYILKKAYLKEVLMKNTNLQELECNCCLNLDILRFGN